MSKVSRQSNIELLRIISMTLVVLYHVFCYSLINYESTYPIVKPLYTLSHIGVPLFVLISGYFGIKISLKGFVNIYLTMVFYNIIMFVGWKYVGDNTAGISEYVKILFPCSHSAPWLWFMKTYILLFLLSPLLNKARDFKPNKVESKMRGGNILILSLLAIIIFYFGWLQRNADLYDGRNVIEFAFLYLLGGFFHDRFEVNNNNRKKYKNILLSIVVVLNLAVGLSLYFAEGVLLEYIRWFFHPYSSPGLLLLASVFFLYFTTLKIQSRVINWIASSVLAIYLVHENRFFDFIPWYKTLDKLAETGETVRLCYSIIIGISIIIVIPILLDKLKQLIINPIIKYIKI